MMSVSALTTFTVQGANYTVEALIVALVFFAVALPATTIWCLFGTAIGGLLRSKRALQMFNWDDGCLDRGVHCHVIRVVRVREILETVNDLEYLFVG